MLSATQSPPTGRLEGNTTTRSGHITEHTFRAISAWPVLATCLALGIAGAWLFYLVGQHIVPSPGLPIIGIACFLLAFFLLKGLIILQPNEAAVCLLFGRYKGTLTQAGFCWLNPLYTRQKLSLRLKTQETGPLKVNDAVGNPVEIGAVIIWRVSEAARATLEVDNYGLYVSAQSETALRLLASRHPYDPTEQQDALPTRDTGTGTGTGTPAFTEALSSITLRDGSDVLASILLQELQLRMAAVGIDVVEARISHLAYAPEIAGAMLRKQAANAVIAARRVITQGAVSIIDDALADLEARMGHQLPPQQRAAMISNLLIVLIGDREATPVVNTGL